MARADMYLALCLLDAIEDANLEALQLLLGKHSANPNTIVLEKDVAPMHLVIGADDVPFAERATMLMLQHGGNPNLPAAEQMLTPLHVAANLGRVAIVRLLLKAGGNVELLDEEGRTPIQHAIDEGHFEVVQVIQNHVFEEKIERKRKQLLLEHQQTYQEPAALLSPSLRYMKSYVGFNPAAASSRIQGNTLSALQVLEERKLTPNKIHYNFDATSPYYVNITHRRKDRFKSFKDDANESQRRSEELALESENMPPQETTMENEWFDEKESDVSDKPVARTNLFELTERNLKNFTRDSQSIGRRTSFIENWREKIAEMRERTQLSRRLDDIDRILNSFSENLTVKSFMDDVEETFVTAPDADNPEPTDEAVISQNHDEPLALPIPTIEVQCEQEDTHIKRSSIHESEDQETVIIQISEEYIHTDDEAGVVFREKKLTTAKVQDTLKAANMPNSKSEPNGPQLVAGGRNPSLTSLSTVITLPPLDYDTDALRAELTTFGEPPGPITKSTKKLYLRKLIKFRRHPERLATDRIVDSQGGNTQPNYSVELMATVRKEDVFGKIMEHQSLEQEMASEFQSSTSKVARNFREGHLKKSFIYLLLDPRVSDNLPAQQTHLQPHDQWRRFLSSIFYVGKGKSSRPYCHLYDAMKLYHQKEQNGAIDRDESGSDLMVEEEKIIFQCTEETAAIPGYNARRQRQTTTKVVSKRKQMAVDSSKLNRILDIWSSGKGVVCLHVFHNIMPAEAYTREAAIIDAFGVQNLTNLKRGDYYAKCLSWPMKTRKQLGILLLYKAMLIFLAEGETQLLPSDLI